jgi:hypothetical protein
MPTALPIHTAAHDLLKLFGSQWVLILGNSYRNAQCLVVSGVDH